MPVAVGVKLTLIVQVAPARTVAPQLLVWLKSPEAMTLEMVSDLGRLLVSVIGCEELLVPTA